MYIYKALICHVFIGALAWNLSEMYSIRLWRHNYCTIFGNKFETNSIQVVNDALLFPQVYTAMTQYCVPLTINWAGINMECFNRDASWNLSNVLNPTAKKYLNIFQQQFETIFWFGTQIETCETCWIEVSRTILVIWETNLKTNPFKVDGRSLLPQVYTDMMREWCPLLNFTWAEIKYFPSEC